MDALILVVVMHCGSVEALLRDSPTKLEWSSVARDEQGKARTFIEQMENSGARVITIEVKDDKCAVST